MKTFQDRNNLHVDVEAIEKYVDCKFRKLNRTTRSMHKPIPNHCRSKYQDQDSETMAKR